MKLALIFFVCSSFTWGAFNATMQFDVRTTGATTNSGGYDPGVASPGTNEAQQDAGTAMTIVSAGTTGTCTPTCTSTTHGPGNTFIIASGAGCSTGIYEILSQAAGTVTFDRTTGAGTCVGVMGGGLTTLAAASTLAISGNTLNIKAGTYTLTTTVSAGQNTVTWLGYGSTWADAGTKPLITTATNSTVLVNTVSANNGIATFQNLSFSNTAGTRESIIQQLSAHGTAQQWLFRDDIFDGGTRCIDSGNGVPFDVFEVVINKTEVKNCTVSGFTSENSSGSTATWVRINESNFHGNAIHVELGPSSRGAQIIRSKFWGAIGAGTSPLDLRGAGIITFDSNTVANNTGSGIDVSSTTTQFYFCNNISYGNTAYGVHAASSTLLIQQAVSSGCNNAYGANTTANYFSFTASPGDISLSADPWVNASIGDFRLNTTSGGGALLRGAAFGDANLDIGAVQSAAGATAPQSTVYGQ